MSAHVRRLVKVMCYLLALFLLGWAFTRYDAIFLGLLLGGAVSFINALYTALKVRQFSERQQAGMKPRGLGMLTRFSMAALAAMAALRFPELIQIHALVVGLILAPAILFIDGLISAFRIRHIEVEREGK